MANITRRAMLAGLGLSTLGLAACGGASSAASTAESASAAGSTSAADATSAAGDGSAATYKIGVLQLVEHGALDAANEGFVEALNEAGIDYVIDQQNAQGDQSACQTIAAKFVGDEDDLILAIATPAVEACAGATTEIPIVGTAVTDFAASGLVKDNAAPGGNITGSSDLTPVADQIKMLHTILPEAKNVGILWCTAESNSDLQAAMAKEACSELGLTGTDYTVSSSNEIQQVVESAASKVDAFYCPTDNTIAAAMATVTMVADEHNIPVICGEESMVDAGGLCTYTISYFELGKLAGQMAVRILVEGADPATMPIEYYPSDKLELKYDEAKATKLGIDVELFKTLEGAATA